MKKGRVKKRKFFHASLFLLGKNPVFSLKKCITPLTP